MEILPVLLQLLTRSKPTPPPRPKCSAPSGAIPRRTQAQRPDLRLNGVDNAKQCRPGPSGRRQRARHCAVRRCVPPPPPPPPHCSQLVVRPSITTSATSSSTIARASKGQAWRRRRPSKVHRLICAARPRERCNSQHAAAAAAAAQATPSSQGKTGALCPDRAGLSHER